MGGVFIIFLISIGIIILIAGAIIFKNKNNFFVLLFGIGITLVFTIAFTVRLFKIVDAGEVGVQVQFGKVLDKTLMEGFNTKSPFANVYTYSIRLKEYTMTTVEGEGQVSGDDSISCRTKDDSQVSVDATVLWSIDPAKAYHVYKKISKNENGLITIIIRPVLRSLIRDQVSKFNLNEVMRNREKLGTEVTGLIIKEVEDKGIFIDKVLIRKVTPPQEVDLAIQRKIKAEQELQQKEFELKKAEKDADIRRAEAKGIADAQEIIQRKLTPLYVQYEAIQSYKTLANSQNTTFIIMPTSTNAAGMPIILNAK